MSKIYSVWDFVRNHKYAMVIVFFTLMVGFVDENSFWQRKQRIEEIAALRSEMQGYRDAYDHDTRALEELEHSREAVIRIAREKYLMKQEGEDVYVLLAPQDKESEETDDETAQ
ncbi:MAG: septum formation initiator family protein [Bacteroidaceae bacterium]|nr:septum formation initiator family protein [Bacteroidaceae bacterium]